MFSDFGIFHKQSKVFYILIGFQKNLTKRSKRHEVSPYGSVWIFIYLP